MKEKLQVYKQEFESYLVQNSFPEEPSALYRPADYIMGIGGKRIRPILLMLGCELFDQEYSRSLPAALAIEYFHNFSLIHDDIMDEAIKRRGKDSVHHKYGLNAGILSGDVVLIYAYKHLLQVQSPFPAEQLLHTFNEAAIEVCEGQQMDMDFEQLETVQLKEYLKMIELKTAALLGCSIQLGAAIGGASERDQLLLRTFGRQLGVAFQIKDDLLDTYGEGEKTGKKVGGDILRAKKTHLWLTAYNKADEETKSYMNELLASSKPENEKIAGIVAVFDRYGVKEICEEALKKWTKDTFESLRQVNVPSGRQRNAETSCRKPVGQGQLKKEQPPKQLPLTL